MSRSASLLLAALVPLTLAGACSTSLDGRPVGEESDPYDPEPGEPGESARIAGTYQVRSLMNFSNSTTGVAGVLNSLENLSDDPAGTLINILEASGNDFLDDVPGFLKDLFASKVNDYIKNKNYSGQKIVNIFLDYGSMVGEMTQRFHAVSEMRIEEPDAAGNSNATHGVVAIEFTYAGNGMVVDVSNSDVTMAQSISVLADNSGGVNIGSHELSLPLGLLALEALEISLQENTGSTSIAGALGLMVDCTGLAYSVGDIQFSGVTLLNVNQIDGLCEQALQLVGSKIEEQFANANINLDVLGGSGLAEANGGSVESVTGSWDMALQGQSLPATFQASRM